MRKTTIRLRAWLHDNSTQEGRMYYAADFNNSNGQLLTYYENNCDSIDDRIMRLVIGERDKNKKEIWEGDIFKMGNGVTGTIVKILGDGSWRLMRTVDERTLMEKLIRCSEGEVIGHECH